MKTVLKICLLTAGLLLLSGCGAAKVLHCDHCGTEIKVAADSNMEEDWIVYCADCNEELFGEDPLLGIGE